MSDKKEEVKGFYAEMTVEVEINGEKHLVNSWEAEKLKSKLKSKK